MRRELPKHKLFEDINWVEVKSLDGRERVVPAFMAHLQNKATYHQLQWLIDWWVKTGHRTDRMFIADTNIDPDPKTWPINRNEVKEKQKPKDFDEIQAYIKRTQGLLSSRKRPFGIPRHVKLKQSYDQTITDRWILKKERGVP